MKIPKHNFLIKAIKQVKIDVKVKPLHKLVTYTLKDEHHVLFFLF